MALNQQIITWTEANAIDLVLTEVEKLSSVFFTETTVTYQQDRKFAAAMELLPNGMARFSGIS